MAAGTDEISVSRVSSRILGPHLESLIARLHSTSAEGCRYIPRRTNGSAEANFGHHRIKGLWWSHNL